MHEHAHSHYSHICTHSYIYAQTHATLSPSPSFILGHGNNHHLQIQQKLRSARLCVALGAPLEPCMASSTWWNAPTVCEMDECMCDQVGTILGAWVYECVWVPSCTQESGFKALPSLTDTWPCATAQAPPHMCKQGHSGTIGLLWEQKIEVPRQASAQSWHTGRILSGCVPLPSQIKFTASVCLCPLTAPRNPCCIISLDGWMERPS